MGRKKKEVLEAEKLQAQVQTIAKAKPVPKPKAESKLETEPETKSKLEWTVKKQCACLWLKFYAEQVDPNIKPDSTKREQVQALGEYLKILGKKDVPFWYHGIIHDKDYNTDDIYSPTEEKLHIHLLVIMYRKKQNGKLAQLRVESILNKLRPLKFRTPDDDMMFVKGTKFPNLRAKEHIKSMVYHTHETYEARQKEGKPLYKRECAVTNIPADVLAEWYKEYEIYMDGSRKNPDVKPLDNNAMAAMIMIAGELGRRGEDFEQWWYENQTANVKLTRSLKTLCREEYDYNLQEFLSSREAVTNVRCCIYINGLPNTGKTYNCKMALQNMGLEYLAVCSGGTGKTDYLKPAHKALIVDDNAVKDILAMSDNGYCRAYRRNSSNGLWCGQYFIITYNGDIDSYIQRFYPQIADNPQQMDAVKSRFYRCTLMGGVLSVDVPASRGNLDDWQAHHKLFKAFYDSFTASVETYKRDCNKTALQSLQEMFPDIPVGNPSFVHMELLKKKLQNQNVSCETNDEWQEIL